MSSSSFRMTLSCWKTGWNSWRSMLETSPQGCITAHCAVMTLQSAVKSLNRPRSSLTSTVSSFPLIQGLTHALNIQIGTLISTRVLEDARLRPKERGNH